MKKILIFFSALGLVVFFQNCSDGVVFLEEELASQTYTENSTVEDDVYNGITDDNVASMPSPPEQSCFPSGHIFTTGNGLPYIHYHKCDGEIESWRSMGQQRCCSGRVTIVDTAQYDDYPTCPRFQGRMTCQ